jgi:hypothetical protein
MTDERKQILYKYARDLNMKIEYRFKKMVDEMIERFGSFTTEDYELFIKYVEYEQTKQTATKRP